MNVLCLFYSQYKIASALSFKTKKILHLKLNMNATISKKEIILGLHQDGKNLDEIQATLMLMFEDDLITSTDVILIPFITRSNFYTECVSNRA